MRISGGQMCGRRIPVKRQGVRPTKERVREALFSSLGDRVSGSRFLDLCCGSGAVGLEAASRGAAEVTWVDEGRGQCRDVERFLELVANDVEAVKTRVVCRDMEQFLSSGQKGPFDQIFADPPYDRDGTEDWPGRLARLIDENELLAAEGVLIMEVASRGKVTSPCGWTIIREKAYGDTRLIIYKNTNTENVG